MGNCSQCFREGMPPQKPKASVNVSSHASTLLDDGSQPRYTKMTLDQVFQDGLDDLNGLQNIDSDTLMNFTVHIYNMRLLNFILKEEIFLQGDIDEDTQKRRKDNYRRNKNNKESIQQTTMGAGQDLDQYQKQPLLSYDFGEEQGVNWKTSKFHVDSDNNIDIELNNHFRYECRFKDIWSKSLIIEFYLSRQPVKPFAFVVVDFLALAIGPKSCDLEVRDFKSRKYLGRIAFDISIKQLQQIELQLFDLTCKLNHKEEKALYGQFKFITSTDCPRVSKPTYSQTGKFKKEKNYTRFKWIMNDDEEEVPVVKQVVSLESLKNSSLQLVLKVDRNFSEAMHRQVVHKMSLVKHYQTKQQDEGKHDSQQIPQIFIEPVEDVSRDLSQVLKDNDMIFMSRDSNRSQNKDLSLLNKDQKLQVRQNLSYIDTNRNIKHHSHAVDDYAKKLTDYDMAQLYNSPQFNQQFNNSQDPLDILQNMQIVKRARSIIQKKNNRKTIVIDAADYYSKYNEVGDNSLSLITSFIGECYIGITKLLQCEYRQFDRRDSQIIRNKLNNSIKLSNQDSASFRESKLEIIAEDEKKTSFQLSKQRGKCDKKYFSEQLWVMGKVIGNLSGTFKVNNLPLIQQMTLGILTENGIVMYQAPILIEERDGMALGTLKRKLRNERITSLIELTKRLKKIDAYKGKKQIYQSYNEKEKILNDIIQILCESDKTVQGHMYKYFDDFDLIRSQQAFVELAFHCLLLIESVRYEFKRDYYEIISQILMRDELKLANVTLKGANCQANNCIDNTQKINRLLDDPNYDKSMQVFQRGDNSLNFNLKNSRINPSTRLPLTQGRFQKQSTNQNIANDISTRSIMTNIDKYDDDTKDRLRCEKMKMAIFYQKLLFQVLDDCLNKFCRKDVEPYLKSYLEICISLAFYRVPQFQRLFINCITEKTQMRIEEWKGVTWNIEEEMDLDIEEGLVSLYDWDSNFHNLIPLSQDIQQLSQKIKANKKWQIRIKKRSIALFQIVKRWANMLSTTVLSQSLFWEDIPGYSIILKQMLVQLKERNVADYADSLIEAIASLLPNTQLLTIFINIIFGKTNAYDSKTLCITMDIATKWINYVEQNGYEFPSNFDFQFFFKGIQVALEMDHSISTPRTIYLIYRILHFLPFNQRSKIISLILTKHFYQLMFSWSYTIRDIFISLLLYQVEYFYIEKFSSQLVQQPRPFRGLSQDPISMVLNDQLQDKDKNFTIENMKQQRKQHIKHLDEKMKQYEILCQENPNEAQIIFEQQFQARRQRLISDSDIRSMTLNKQLSEQQPKLDRQISEIQQSHNIDESRAQIQNKDSALNSFLKAHSCFRQKIIEIETIEEYLTKKKNEKGQLLQKQNSSQHASSPSLMEQQSTEVKSTDIETSYQKIVQNIPQQNRVYIGQAIDEYYRQIEEYELWRGSSVSYFCDVLANLPEFNMEKNMPVEDDENLEKMEEW